MLLCCREALERAEERDPDTPESWDAQAAAPGG
jgi:hypothetical protein